MSTSSTQTATTTTPAATPAAAPAPEVKPTTPAAAAQPTTPAPAPEVKPGETPAPEKPKETPAPEVPEKYELKLPEGSKLDQAHVDSVAAYAKENKLTAEQAQKMLERDNTIATTREKAQVEAFKHQADVVWVNEIKNDKEFGGENFAKNAELAKRAIDKFGDEGIRKVLDETGYGNHPGLVKMFMRIGQAIGDDKFENLGAEAAGTKSAADILYPNQGKK